MSEAELVAKANLAVRLLCDEGCKMPQGITFMSVQKLQHGGCLSEVYSIDATQWLK